jgi:hypothetical protein
MKQWIFSNIEVVPIVMNLGIVAVFIYKWDEPGKIVYWAGATILVIGIWMMKG